MKINISKYTHTNAFTIVFSFVFILFSTNVNAGLADDTIGRVENKIDNIIDRTSGLKARTENTLDEVREISESFRAGLSAISAEVSDATRYSLQDIDQILAMHREGLADFLSIPERTPVPNSSTEFDFSSPSDRSQECLAGSPCFQFRLDIKNLITQLSQLGNTIMEIDSDPATRLSFNLNKVIDLIDRVPGRALFPLYAVMVASQEPGFLSRIESLVQGALIDIQTLNTAASGEDYQTLPIVPETDYSFLEEQYVSGNCFIYLENYLLMNRTRQGLFITGAVVKFISKGLIAVGETYVVKPKLAGGFAEFLNAHIALSDNNPKMIGSFFDGVADVLLAGSSTLKQKVLACSNIRAQQIILERQYTIMQGICYMSRNGAPGCP